jgi:hypothetical protein
LIQELLLVDFENVQQIDLSRLGSSINVIIFIGANQKSIPVELVTSAQKFGSRIEWKQVDGHGTIALR